MTPAFDADFVDVGIEVEPGEVPVEVACAVWMIVDPDCVIVNVGGFPVARGPTEAEPAAGWVAVAPPSELPPIMDWTVPGT